jgi:hypothetical protein
MSRFIIATRDIDDIFNSLKEVGLHENKLHAAHGFNIQNSSSL